MPAGFYRLNTMILKPYSLVCFIGQILYDCKTSTVTAQYSYGRTFKCFIDFTAYRLYSTDMVIVQTSKFPTQYENLPVLV